MYFVLTELLIAEHIVPLLDSLMKDNLGTILKKLIDRSSSQGNDFPSSITFSNHLDYQKWHNHQRLESTEAVFKVIDRALGYKDLISQTHKIFKNFLIYYARAPLLFSIDKDLNGVNFSNEQDVCWN